MTLATPRGKIKDMYTTNPHMPKVRRDAVNLVKYRHWSMRKAVLRFGVEPSTISRWCAHAYATGWHEILTKSSRPHTSPNALKREVVEAIIEKKLVAEDVVSTFIMNLKGKG